MDGGALYRLIGTEYEGYLTGLFVTIAEPESATQRGLQTCEGAEEGGLAATVSAQHADYLPAAEGECQVALNNLGAVADGEMVAKEHEVMRDRTHPYPPYKGGSEI